MKLIIVFAALVLVAIDAQDIKGRIACEGKSFTLNCGTGEYLEIVGGNFGRTSGDVCSRAKNNNCVSGWSLWHMKNKCNNSQSCTLSATTAEMGDPCPYTRKYLETYYRCVKEIQCNSNEYKCKEKKCIPKSKVCDGLKDCNGGEDESGCNYATNYACETKILHLTCKPGEIIRIINGFWGRNDKTTCGISGVTNCSSNKADEYIKNKCNFQTTCSIPANVKELGEPCSGTYKFIQVQYTCWTVPRMLEYLSNEL